MRAGVKDRRVTFQVQTEVDDPYGGTITDWADSFTTWAEVIMQGGREFFAADRIDASQQALFRTAWFADADVTMRIVYKSVAYDINAIREIGRREGLEFQTTWTA